MEDQNDDNQEDFWLLQYQKLIDSQPIEVSQQTAAIDSALGYQILVNGVIHTLPFFSKLWLTHQSDLENLTDADLLVAGIKNQRDRVGVLRSIETYLREKSDSNDRIASAPSIPSPTTTNQSNFESASAPSTSGETNYLSNKINTYYECVICMDNEVSSLGLLCSQMINFFFNFSVSNYFLALWTSLFLLNLSIGS
jgi:E3 ubiquitin-protein ligase LRSAM1